MFDATECIHTKFNQIATAIIRGRIDEALNLIKSVPEECLRIRDVNRETLLGYAADNKQDKVVEALRVRLQLGG